jgi:alpha-L-glutamate ligase-like protein
LINITKFFENRRKVLGMNERNLVFIRKSNNKKAIRIADDKILTKKVLTKANIPTPKLITTINDAKELENFDWNSIPNSFVLKPVTGIEGAGIDIFYNRDKDGKWIRADKSKATLDDLKLQITEILDGKYSLNHIHDRVLLEERVKTHKAFKYYTYKGTPDIRIIVYNKVPVMSFLRLPTKESNGKANLALGAIGAGIDLANGITTSAIQGKNKSMEFVPGTKLLLGGLKIPYWNKMLTYAVEAQKATNINYVAVDFLIDRDLGPLIVELNARPGLSIQLANNDGIRWRIKKAQGLKVGTIEKGVRLAKYLFGGEIEEEVETITGKDVIGILEKISLFDQNSKEIETKAKIDTGADSTSIDTNLAIKLGYQDIIDKFSTIQIPENSTKQERLAFEKALCEELIPQFPGRLTDIQFIISSHGKSLRPYVKIQIKLKDTTFETNASIFNRSELTYPVIIGRKSLSRFLVDPSKNAI